MSVSPPDLEQHEVDTLLTRSGLAPVRPFELGTFESNIAFRVQSDSSFARPSVFSLLGEELPELVPKTLAGAQVLYFALLPSMEPLLPRLLTPRWDCYGDLTSHPWTHAVYLALQDSMEEGSTSTRERPPILAMRSDALDLTRAFVKGFAVLMFDCAGRLWTRGIPVGEDLAMSLSACAQSTFQRPLRIHSVRYLQERTRMVEVTGDDPEGKPNGGYPVLPVLCSELTRPRPFDFSRLPEDKKRLLPKARCHRMCDAVIGWLPEVTHFQEECAGESPLVLKVTVVPQMYRRILEGNFSASVRMARDQLTGDFVYALMVESGDELTVVTLPLDDARFIGVYRYWARIGRCQVVFENFHNGRLHRSRLAWPSFENGCPSTLCYTDALVAERVRDTGISLTWYSCGVSDQEGWRQEREQN